MAEFKMKFSFNSSKSMKRLGIEDKGPVQRLIDSEVLRLSDPYVPFDEASIYESPGRLRQSGIQNTIVGSGQVVYNTPYARWLYYNPQFQFQGAPLRGGYWVDRAMQDGGLAKIKKEIKEYMKGKSNG